MRPQSARFDRAEKVGTVYIPINPVPASRPRVGKWGTYYSKTYRRWRKEAEKVLTPGLLNLEGPLMVVANHVVQRPKTTKLDYPKPDVDNFCKATLDAITRVGGYWEDDHQIVELITTKRWTRGNEEPHAKVEIWTWKENE